MKKNAKRVHRLVVLPDYQGIGIGMAFINKIAEMYRQQGYEFNLTTTTPAITYALRKSDKWILARYGREKSGFEGYERYAGAKTKRLKNATSKRRITYSFWYK